jgi:hypothetical protein
MAIEERMRDAFAQDRVRLFWADTFVNEGLGTVTEVLEALFSLAADEKLVPIAEVRPRRPQEHTLPRSISTIAAWWTSR